jgi:hypothetical protein
LAQKKYPAAILASEKSIEIAEKCYAIKWIQNQFTSNLENLKDKLEH